MSKLSFYTPFSTPTAATGPGVDGGGDRLFSHCFMRSEAVRWMLLGVRRFSTGGSSSSSLLLGEGLRE